MNDDFQKIGSGHFPLFLANCTNLFYFALSFQVFLKKGFFDAALVFIVTWIVKKLSNVIVSMIYVNIYTNKLLNDKSEDNDYNPFDMEKGRFWAMMASEWIILVISAYIVL